MNLKCAFLGHERHETYSSQCKNCGFLEMWHKEIFRSHEFTGIHYGCDNFKPDIVWVKCKREPSILVDWRYN